MGHCATFHKLELSVKCQKKRECGLARAKVNSMSPFSGPIPAFSSLPSVNGLISEISSSSHPCAVIVLHLAPLNKQKNAFV